jgi:hypothetical protein
MMKTMRRTGWISILAFGLACSSTTEPAGDGQVCDEATAAVEACLGAPPQAPWSQCDADAQDAAQEILDGLEAAGCQAVPEGKDDSVFCKVLLWDPLAWCAEPPPPLGPEPTGEPTRFPIILAHGFNTSTTNFWRTMIMRPANGCVRFSKRRSIVSSRLTKPRPHCAC